MSIQYFNLLPNIAAYFIRTIYNCVASTDLQMVNLSLRVLARPDERLLPEMYQELGLDYDERVLPSICNEVLAGNSLRHLF